MEEEEDGTFLGTSGLLSSPAKKNQTHTEFSLTKNEYM